MDKLVKGKISQDIKSEKNIYDLVMSKTARYVSIGIALILLGVTIMMTILGFSNESNEEQFVLIGVVAILIGVVFAVPLFIVSGTREEDFKKKNPVVANIYSEEELEKGNSKYIMMLSIGVSIILVGVVVMMTLLGLKVFGESTLPVAVLMLFVTIGVTLIVYSGKMKDKLDIDKYNKENSKEYRKQNDMVGKICGVLMMLATIIFLGLGFTLNMWYIAWIVYPICGILCGIISIILKKDSK